MKDELLIKYLLKESTEEENAAVKNWLAEDAANEVYYLQFEKIWDAGKSLAVKSKVDEEQAWQKFKERTAAVKKEAIVRPLKKYTWMKVAAMITLVAGIWLGYNLLNPVTYTDLTAKNQIIKEKLPDGSEITLNKNSAISYASNFTRNRSLRLKKGDVFFNVAHDESKPFVIDVDQVSVTVVGTSFNVKHQAGETEVNVESGIVRVSVGREEVELRRGEKVVIRDKNPELLKEKNTDQVYNYYHSGVIIANNTPILKIAEILEDVYGVDIKTDDPSIDAMTVKSTFLIKYSLNQNLKILQQTMDLKVTRNGNQILLSKLR
ncbi:FecR family protein [Pedobacter psychroterrae]|uniref:DUF4974 domain-containing protein n=1 Tax=Pedobacter psychroterrae TaxID=2530453 RepID=A0A4R0NRD7_9SPHI|nr:FecR domain-containing protein [Pedobacter psychroterrae]TCD01644.1 DUF4974 domain-containing protein [Pedobacter psychroterrae]